MKNKVLKILGIIFIVIILVVIITNIIFNLNSENYNSYSCCDNYYREYPKYEKVLGQVINGPIIEFPCSCENESVITKTILVLKRGFNGLLTKLGY